VQHYYNSDDKSQWETLDFEPPMSPTPCNQLEIRYGWLCQWCDPQDKNGNNWNYRTALAKTWIIMFTRFIYLIFYSSHAAFLT